MIGIKTLLIDTTNRETKLACRKDSIYITYIKFFAKYSRDVAQLVAHSLWERGVASSSLAIPTIFFRPSFML